LAISKILYIKDCGSSHNGKHLRQAINYIMVKEKTGNGKYVGGLNCQPEFAYEQMKKTKGIFGKVEGRQGYHLIISFEDGEVDAPTAFEIIGRFTNEYLANGYEAVYTVHDNTDHIHGHILYNSVNFITGMKYRYEKGDWARDIQPITNRLCQEYGLSTIEISEDREKPDHKFKEWNDYRDGSYAWSKMICRDLDACILQSQSFDTFVELLSEKGYEVKQGGKYLAVKPMGMIRFKRCKTLGEEYTEERIKERILTETLTLTVPQNKNIAPHIIRCKVKRLKRAKLTKLQKRYYARLYRIRKLKKRPYSQVWKYRDEIRKMQQIQERYLFLLNHEIMSIEELVVVGDRIAEGSKKISKEKSRTFKARAKCQSLFDIAAEMEELKDAESSFVRGELFFQAEHERYHELAEQLRVEGYCFEEVMELRENYRNEISQVKEKEKAAAKEISIVKAIIRETMEEKIRQQKQSVINEEIPEIKMKQSAETAHSDLTHLESIEKALEEQKGERQPRR